MRKRERFAHAVVVCLLVLSAASANAQSAELSISPTHLFVFDVENFLTLRGATLGSDSTVVTYTLGEQVFTVQPQVNAEQPVLSDVWVPIDVASTVGSWEIRVIATDTGGAQRVYGPAFLDV